MKWGCLVVMGPATDMARTTTAIAWASVAVATFLLALVVTPPRPAAVILRSGDAGPERAFFERLLRETRAECDCDFTMDRFHIGRFDLNDDGRYELFVWYEHSVYCGSAGCKNAVFEWQGSQWKDIASVHAWVDSERIGGYRTLLGEESGERWGLDETTGEQGYHHFCRTLWCLQDFDVDLWRLEAPARAHWADQMPSFATEWVVLRREVFGLEQDLITQIHRDAVAECRCDMTTLNVSVGRFDLDGDGQYELFVAYRHPYFCDGAGCRNPVFQWRKGKWRQIAALDGGWWWRPEYIWVLGKHRGPDGYPTLLGRHMGVRWARDEVTGRAGYQPFCLSDECVRLRGYRRGVN